MAKKDLIDLAKGSDKKTTGAAKKNAAKKTTGKKKVTKKPVVKKPTPEELRDQKAKETVKELLEDSPIVTLTETEEIIELDETTTEQPKGVEWLEEQVTLLTEKNATLTAQMDVVKGDFEKILQENQNLKAKGTPNNIANDGELKTTVIQLFNELQENHIKLGIDKNGIGNFRIYCPGFLNRLIKFFPFLEEVKRYQ